MLEQIILYFQTSSDRWMEMLTAHLMVSLTSLMIAIAIAVPVGIMCVSQKA